MMKLMILFSMLYSVAGIGTKQCFTGEIKENEIAQILLPVLIIIYASMIYAFIKKPSPEVGKQKDELISKVNLGLIIVLSTICYIVGLFL